MIMLSGTVPEQASGLTHFGNCSNIPIRETEDLLCFYYYGFTLFRVRG
jgi:hypothetical protein